VLQFIFILFLDFAIILLALSFSFFCNFVHNFTILKGQN
jgi:hypothetical protein